MIAALPYMISGVIGALIATRNSPKARLQKMQCFGPKSGLVYEVDLVPNLGIVIVHAPNGVSGVFQANQPPKTGFTFVRGVGPDEVIAMMKRDIES